jgi:hypothetical protein
MTTVELPRWERPHWEPGGGDAHLFYKLHGDFSRPPTVSRSRYRTEGPPATVELTTFTDADSPDAFAFGLDDFFLDDLRATRADLAAAVARAPQALVLRGAVADPDSLDYLRDTVGLITALLDTGGALAVFDPFRFHWWTPDEWRERAFDAGGPAPRHHVVILVSPEAADGGGGVWVHTRGMIKFGRPDLSVRGVTDDELPAIEDLCNRFIEMMAFGAIVPEGQPIRMRALAGEWTCHHGGDLDDPEFNNVHLEIRRVG